MIKIIDGGVNWVEVFVDLLDGLNILEVFFISLDIGWIVNWDLLDYFWKMVDGGLMWVFSLVF